jgi:hypothetical protein
MKCLSAALGLVLVVAGTMPAGLLAAPPPGVGSARPVCAPPPHCAVDPAPQRLSFPAGTLSFGLPSSAFSIQARGLRWESRSGVASLTIRRPPDYDGSNVTVTLLHKFIGDDAGDIAFIVTPVSFNHNSGFETYGDELTSLLATPESPTIIYEQSAVLHAGEPGYQWPPSGGWWYFEFRRSGSFDGPIELMAVSIDY